MVLEMGHIPCEYSFYITGNMGYVMDEGGESAYAHGRKPIRISL